MVSLDKDKIAIIGAGIIGTYLAWKLQDKGFKVTVFEKKNRVGQKPCSALISERIKKFVPIPDDLYLRRIESVLVHFPRKDIKIIPKPSFLLFEREKLDFFVFSLAQKSGVDFVFNKEIKEIPEGFSKVVGCHGSLSQTREFFSLPPLKIRLGLQYFVQNKNFDTEIEIYPHRFKGVSKNEFFWKIPKGDQIEYGVIGSSKSAKQDFDIFCQEHNINLDPRQIKGALISQGLSLPNSKTVTLCGDAIGLTKPTTGGGVIWGMTSADMLIENFSDFRRYKNKITRFFWPKIIKGKTEVLLGCLVGNYLSFLLPKKVYIDADLF